MGQRGLGQHLDVVRDHVVSAEKSGKRLAGPIESQRPTRRRAEVDVGMRPGRVHQANDVVGNRRVDIDLSNGRL